MCIADKKAGRLTTFKQTVIDPTVIARTAFPADPRRLAIAFSGDANFFTVQTVNEASTQSGFYTYRSGNGPGSFILKVEDYGQLIMGAFFVNVTFGGNLILCVNELIATAPLDLEIQRY